jgi:hypothetical protein
MGHSDRPSTRFVTSTQVAAPRRRWVHRHPIVAALAALAAVGGVASAASAHDSGSTTESVVQQPADTATAGGGTSNSSISANLMSCMADARIKQVAVSPSNDISTVDIWTTLPGAASDPTAQNAGHSILGEFQKCYTAATGRNGLVSVYAVDDSMLTGADY